MPYAPPGWKVLCFEYPDQGLSWAPHGVEGFNIGHAEDHYRCYQCYIPTTGGTRTINTVVFFPPKNYTTVTLPTPEETMAETANNLGQALTKAACNNPVYQTLTAYSGLQKFVRYNN